MARTLTFCALLLSCTPTVRADDAPRPTETVIRLNVSRMTAPKPALRYPLLPELREITPGNPVQGYLKCFMEQNNFFFHKDAVANREKRDPSERAQGFSPSGDAHALSNARCDF